MIDIQDIARGDDVGVEIYPFSGTSLLVISQDARTLVVGSKSYMFPVLGIRDDGMALVISILDPAVQAHGVDFTGANYLDRWGGTLVPISAYKGFRTWVIYEDAIAAHYPAFPKPPPAPPVSACCDNCGDPNQWGAPSNQPNGQFFCYACRQDPLGRKSFKKK